MPSYQILENGYAYRIDGDVYFSVDKLPEYGRLSGRKLEDNRAGERVAVDSRKKNPADFALWKVSVCKTLIMMSTWCETWNYLRWLYLLMLLCYWVPSPPSICFFLLGLASVLSNCSTVLFLIQAMCMETHSRRVLVSGVKVLGWVSKSCTTKKTMVKSSWHSCVNQRWLASWCSAHLDTGPVSLYI